ncbi:MAG TPA: N-acetyl-gamma-glutamyl-phosphate reductase, partial [Chloroflexi bacterium]|nr:N-acetyl-gamma-glutamyl-phosphate reductase [Chloroflexota bacterium]
MAGLKASIVGGSGYAGGELLRLLLGHPEVEVAQVTSRSLAGKLVTTSHPNLRKRTTLKYSMPAALESCDVLFICVPHGASSPNVSEYLDKAGVIIDLSADFRLRDATDYKTWYGWEHPRPELIPTTVYGLPELHREEIRQANYIASPGCNATASILALYPLAASGLLDPTMPIVVEAKSGSSGSGVESGPASHHPERSGVMRSFKPTGHRHSAEVIQELSVNGFCPKVSFTATSVEAVRGILATAHAFTKEPVTDKDLWKIYRGVYGSEPFVRIVKETHGIHRTPEPKILSGTNFCDVGFDVDPHGNRVVVTAAIDNLMKGAAGQALQAMNIRMGFEETLGLESVSYTHL